MEETGIIRRQHPQQYLQVGSNNSNNNNNNNSSRPHSVVARLTRESSGEGVSSSDDELAGETLFDARVGVHCRKKSSRGGVQFEADPADRVLQLQGDQLKLKKKGKLKAKIFVYYVWVRRNISDYVPRDSHKLKDESLAVIAGWYSDVMIVTFATSGAKETFLMEFQRVNQETLKSLYGDQVELSEQCLITLGTCVCGASPGAAEESSSQTLSVKPYETANDVVLKCKSAFKLEPSQRVILWLDGSSGYGMVGCESVFSTILYQIHEKHKSDRRRGSVLSEASSTSPNDSNSMELEETFAKSEAPVRLSLHSQETCANASCTTKKKKHHHHHQLRRTSEVPSKIRNWISSNNRKSLLIRQGSVEALSASGGGGSGAGASEASPIIGRSLAELYPTGTVSRPVTCLLAQIYHRCYPTRGIFRQPGSVSEKNQVLQLLSQYDLTKGDNMKQLNEFGEHCIADALKHYLRNLPGCLLQRNLSSQWTRVVRDMADDTPAAVAAIRAVIQQMQPQNAHLLHMLMTTLRRVADNHDQNQMTAANIGTSVSFSVLDLDLEGISLEVMEQEAQRINKLIDLMISNFSAIWPDEEENARVMDDFVRHICQGDELSSMESLITEGARHLDATEPLSLSSVSKDSGLQLSDQQLDDSRNIRKSALVAVSIPERSLPPPYDIAVKRQARSQHPRPQPPPPPQEVSTPRRERPPVPARLHRRPASVGPSSRRPLPAAPAAVATFDPLGESKSRHPLGVTTTDGRQPASPLTPPPPTPPLPPQSSRPVRTAAAAAVAKAAAAAASASQPPPPPPLSSQQPPRFRKRSSSETRLDLIGLPSAASSAPFQSGFHQHQRHQQPPPHQHRTVDSAAQHRRQEFERLSRLHTRDSFEAVRQFSSRHAPIRSSATTAGDAAGSPRQPRPRTRLPEALQLKLADQPESLV